MCHLISSPTIFFLSPWKRHLLKCTTFHISREEFRPGIWPVCYPQTPHLLDPEVQAQGQCQPLGGWPTPCPTTQGHTGASQQRQFTIPTFYPKVNLLKGINNCLDAAWSVVKFIYSEKATKFCEIFSLLLTVCTVVRWRFRKILWPSQNIWTLNHVITDWQKHVSTDDRKSEGLFLSL